MPQSTPIRPELFETSVRQQSDRDAQQLPSGRQSASVSDSSIPDLYIGKAVTSDDRDGLASHARYAGIRAHERPPRR
jgi:hypothetical protein